MQVIYEAEVIESILNSLNKIQITGIVNSELLTFIVQELGKNTVSDKNMEN